MQINGPVTIKLSPEGITRVLDALAERPFKDVAGVIQDIINQLKVQEDAKHEQHAGTGNSD